MDGCLCFVLGKVVNGCGWRRVWAERQGVGLWLRDSLLACQKKGEETSESDEVLMSFRLLVRGPVVVGGSTGTRLHHQASR